MSSSRSKDIMNVNDRRTGWNGQRIKVPKLPKQSSAQTKRTSQALTQTFPGYGNRKLNDRQKPGFVP